MHKLRILVLLALFSTSTFASEYGDILIWCNPVKWLKGLEGVMVKQDQKSNETTLLVYTESASWGAVDETPYSAEMNFEQNNVKSFETFTNASNQKSSVAYLELPEGLTPNQPAVFFDVNFVDNAQNINAKVNCEYLPQ